MDHIKQTVKMLQDINAIAFLRDHYLIANWICSSYQNSRREASRIYFSWSTNAMADLFQAADVDIASDADQSRTQKAKVSTSDQVNPRLVIG